MGLKINLINLLVLLAEDNKTNQLVIGKKLEPFGFMADDGAIAFE